MKSTYDYKARARDEYNTMGIDELDALVRHHQQQAQVERFMSSGFSLSYEAMERHNEKMAIAAAVLKQREAAGERLINSAFAAAA